MLCKVNSFQPAKTITFSDTEVYSYCHNNKETQAGTFLKMNTLNWRKSSVEVTTWSVGSVCCFALFRIQLPRMPWDEPWLEPCANGGRFWWTLLRAAHGLKGLKWGSGDVVPLLGAGVHGNLHANWAHSLWKHSRHTKRHSFGLKVLQYSGQIFERLSWMRQLSAV